MTTVGHRYELHRTNTHETDENGRRYRWCIYDYFNVNGQTGLSFWYFTTKQSALSTYPEAEQEWHENDSHGNDCAMRITSSAECTCGKLDYLAEQAVSDGN